VKVGFFLDLQLKNPRLNTKIQYKNFEPGEFTSEKDRTADETLELITTFPWQDQRDHLVVSLTNPGITIEGDDNDYLKLTPYYNGKYVLHYFDAQHHLYTLALDRPEEAAPAIRTFFESQPFDPASAGFRRETTLLQNNAVHFVTNDFHYTIESGLLFKVGTSAVLFLLAIVILAIGLLKQPALLLMGVPFSLAMVTQLALFINHYKTAHGKLLIVSKGLDAFSYGPPDNPKTFYKHDIASIHTVGERQRDTKYGPLSIVEINFMDGSRLRLSCLLIDQQNLLAKFPNCPKTAESKYFPFINRDASALFE
jgi:hypothetical protein